MSRSQSRLALQDLFKPNDGTNQSTSAPEKGSDSTLDPRPPLERAPSDERAGTLDRIKPKKARKSWLRQFYIVRSRTLELLRKLLRLPTLRWLDIRRVVKATFGFMLATALLTITAFSVWLSTACYFIPLGYIFSQPARPIGAQIEQTVMLIIAIILGFAWDILLNTCLYFSQNPDGSRKLPDGIIMGLFLFVGMFYSALIRAYYVRLGPSIIVFSLSIIFSCTRDAATSAANILAPTSSAVALVGGVVMALIVNVLVWPETASQSVARSLGESLLHVHHLLNLTTKSFLLDVPTLATITPTEFKNAETQQRESLRRLEATMREAQYEVTYGRFSPTSYRSLVHSIVLLSRSLHALALVVENEKWLLLDAEHSTMHHAGTNQFSTSFGPTEPSKIRDERLQRTVLSDRQARDSVPLTGSLTVDRIREYNANSWRSLIPSSVVLDILPAKMVSKGNREMLLVLLSKVRFPLQNLINVCAAVLDKCMYDLCQADMNIRDPIHWMFQDLENEAENEELAESPDAPKAEAATPMRQRRYSITEETGKLRDFRPQDILSLSQEQIKLLMDYAIRTFKDREQSIIRKLSRDKDTSYTEEVIIRYEKVVCALITNTFIQMLLMSSFIVRLIEIALRIKDLSVEVHRMDTNNSKKKRIWLPSISLKWLNAPVLSKKHGDADIFGCQCFFRVMLCRKVKQMLTGFFNRSRAVKQCRDGIYYEKAEKHYIAKTETTT